MRRQALVMLLMAPVVMPLAAQEVDATVLADQARGAALLAPFKGALKSALSEGLAAGPQAAIAVCQAQAPAIAERLSVDGVHMGRSSERLRNPKNSPPDWVVPILTQYARGDLAPVTVALSPTELGYVEPIHIAPPCLTCHGETLESSVQEALADRYPQDRATGYQLGQWRGVFWVRYPATTASSDKAQAKEP
ncbi:DUF3365 domain-containing protein [Ferrimonas balearica]|uniref:c-type heme family protein n=1 Tax=Ferrimonas balearica TaxID=44012 RepID=UPI001C98E7BC|nr:DUF3365 domain-containing protein [Ferrimonas balearica]MBY5990813.1 DUF3365 domain-containing protein [Ferrimonas balearica]